MAMEITLENLRTLAERRGLQLSDSELKLLLPGVIRARNQAAQLRDLVGDANEPAGIFDATRQGGK